MTDPDRSMSVVELRALLNKATPGPWVSKRVNYPRSEHKCDGIEAAHNHDSSVACYETDDCPARKEIVTTDSGVYGPSWDDALLIVALRNAAPALLDELDRLHEAQAAHANYLAVRRGPEEDQIKHLASAGDRLNRAMRAIGLRSDD